MKVHAITLSLVMALTALGGCRTSTTTTEVEDLEEPRTSEARAPKEQPKAPPIRKATPMQDRAPPQPHDSFVCALESSREDCRECCQVLGSDTTVTCSSACDEKPPADDCRNARGPHGCAAGESCQYCWTRYVCLEAGTIC